MIPSDPAAHTTRRAAVATLATGLAAWSASPLAQHPPPTPWPEVADQLPDAVYSGSARLHFWGFEVYDAQLWIDPNFRTSRLGAHPLALSLT